MTYKLYSATDTRDSRPMLWLHCTETSKVALFHPKTAVTRIKRLTAVASQSAGIAGWHLNGDLAGWNELLPEVGEAIVKAKGGEA